MSDASKPIRVVSAFSLRSARPRMAASKLAKVGPSSSGRSVAVSPLAKASTMVVKAARAPAGEADRLEARIGGANGRDAGRGGRHDRGADAARPAGRPTAATRRIGARQRHDIVVARIGRRARSPTRGARRRRCRRRERIARRRTLVARAFAQHRAQPQDQEDRDQPDKNDVVVVTHDGAPPTRSNSLQIT